jgi:hypothetical protein
VLWGLVPCREGGGGGGGGESSFRFDDLAKRYLDRRLKEVDDKVTQLSKLICNMPSYLAGNLMQDLVDQSIFILSNDILDAFTQLA